jgi:integrase
VRLSELRRRDVQHVVDQLVSRGELSGSKVRNVLMPLRTIVRLALEDDDLAVNPTSNLRLPATAKSRERVASPEEAAQLLDALAEDDRPLWATAFYAGLRRGELRGLRNEDVDLERNLIHVRHGWDDVEGEIDPKSAKGTRDVPVAGVLRLFLLEQRARTGRRGRDLFFGSTASRPFTPTNIRKRALGAWAATAVGAFLRREPLAVELAPIGLHECRHTYVSLMVDAGFTLERIGDYVGHSSTYMTDRYRHLIEGHETEAAERFDAYLELRGAHSGAHPPVRTLEVAR